MQVIAVLKAFDNGSPRSTYLKDSSGLYCAGDMPVPMMPVEGKQWLYGPPIEQEVHFVYLHGTLHLFSSKHTYSCSQRNVCEVCSKLGITPNEFYDSIKHVGNLGDWQYLNEFMGGASPKTSAPVSPWAWVLNKKGVAHATA